MSLYKHIIIFLALAALVQLHPSLGAQSATTNIEASVREIDRLNALSRGPDHIKAIYGLTKLSDILSATEFKELHLSDEKPPGQYGKSWSDGFPDPEALKNDGTGVEPYHNGEHSDHQRQGAWGNEPHDNVYISARNSRATLPFVVDW